MIQTFKNSQIFTSKSLTVRQMGPLEQNVWTRNKQNHFYLDTYYNWIQPVFLGFLYSRVVENGGSGGGHGPSLRFVLETNILLAKYPEKIAGI